jgi:GNAT superfamily N-acetyltransferase
MEVRRVTDAEFVAASRLTIPGLPPGDSAAREVLDDADQSLGINARRQIVALDGQVLLGSCLYVLTAGRGATVLAPGSGQCPAGSASHNIRSRLVATAREAALADGAVLVQAILEEPPEDPVAQAFLDGGFALLTRLKYLEAPVRRVRMNRPEGPWEAMPYNVAIESRFSDTITRTYHGSLDCPALDGTRSPEDVLAGHKGSGLFTAAGWFLIADGAADVGVVLVNRHMNRSACEIVYMGIVPKYRGRGLGRWLVAQAAAVAKSMDAAVLTVAVDVENAPACRLYRETGFRKVSQRYVYFATSPELGAK